MILFTPNSPVYAAGPVHHHSVEQFVNSDFPAAVVSTAVIAANATKKTLTVAAQVHPRSIVSTAPSADSSVPSSESFSSSFNLTPSFSYLKRLSKGLTGARLPNYRIAQLSSHSSLSSEREPVNNDTPSLEACSSTPSTAPQSTVASSASEDDDPGVSPNTDVDKLFDWESWKQDDPFWLHAAAGSCAGVVEHSLMYPIDTIKTRIQALTQQVGKQNLSSASVSLRIHKLAITDIWKELYTESGFRGFFRGLPAICAGCIPAHAALFTVYEVAKSEFSTRNPMSSAICGGLATVSHDFILTPTDVVKQRLQLGCYSGVTDCVRTTLRTEGWRAFYRSMPTTLFMNVPFGALLVTANEGLKHWLGLEKILQRGATQQAVEEEQEQESNDDQLAWFHIPSTLLGLYFLSAGIAGGLAGALTTPLDVIKTRLQTQDIKLATHNWSSPPQSSNNTQTPVTSSSRLYSTRSCRNSCVRMPSKQQPVKSFSHQSQANCHIWVNRIKPDDPGMLTPRPPRYTGTRGFWKGTTARLALSIPSAAICWGTYESVKYILSRNFLDK